MEEDIKILEEMRDNIYGEIQFEDDYEVRRLEQKQFDALNLAINHLRKTKLVHSQFIPKSKVQEKIEEIENRRTEDGECELALHGFQREAKIQVLQELLED